MILHDGETVYLSFTSAGNYHEAPRAWVTEAIVLDAAHRVVRETENGDRVRVLSDVEGVHQCQAAAWARCSSELAAFASSVRLRAEECAAQAAKLEVAVA
jgi:hypothetical protein